MKREYALLGSALLAAGVVVPALAETRSVTGQLIDLGNYVAGHSAREYTGIHARACALEGFPVGLLTPDKKVYEITGDLAANANAKLIPHMLEAKVTVTGDVTEKNGLSIIAASELK